MPERIDQKTAIRLLRTYLPRGWIAVTTDANKRHRTGICIFEHQLIHCPPITGVRNLQIFLHEIYHARYHDVDNYVREHVMEYEAEIWSMAELEKLGYPVADTIVARAKKYVESVLDSDRQCGVEIDPIVEKWCEITDRT